MSDDERKHGMGDPVDDADTDVLPTTSGERLPDDHTNDARPEAPR